MKNWKFVSGFISACIVFYVLARLMSAEMANILEETGYDFSISKAISISVIAISAGAVSIIFYEEERLRGFIIPAIAYAIAFVLITHMRKEEKDLLVIGIWFAVCAAVDLVLLIFRILFSGRNGISEKNARGTIQTGSDEWVVNKEYISNPPEASVKIRNSVLQDVRCCPRCGGVVVGISNGENACGKCNIKFKVMITRQ